jgi:Phosphotransferase enzyme family
VSASSAIRDAGPAEPGLGQAVRAVEVWCAISGDDAAAVRAEMLKETPKSQVYRLRNLRSGRPGVIAKRRRLGATVVEQTVYETILPRLPVASPPYYGTIVEDDGTYAWLLLGDVGEEWYDPDVASHRDAAARWLASLHLGPWRDGEAERMPSRGAGHYAEHLREGRAQVRAFAEARPLVRRERAVVAALLARYDDLDGAWNGIEAFCATAPATVVHGDFVGKNVRVRETGNSIALFPFDWETAGWAPPAADLARFPREAAEFELYASLVRPAWPDVSVEVVERLAAIGFLFRALATVNWAAAKRADHPERFVATLAKYEPHLAAAVTGRPWETNGVPSRARAAARGVRA